MPIYWPKITYFLLYIVAQKQYSIYPLQNVQYFGVVQEMGFLCNKVI